MSDDKANGPEAARQAEENVTEEKKSLVSFLLHELKPKGKLLTPFNIITAPVIAVGMVLIVIRLAKGLGAVSNLNQDFPWGLWIGFDVITGVAFAGGAYVMTFVVYIARAEKYRPIIRAVVLNGFLAYLFYTGGLVLDVGRPWKMINVIIGNDWGTNSILFLVAWHFLLYIITEFVEFSPAIAEWLGWKRVRKVLHGLTLGAVIFGIPVSTLHQAGLGGLYLMAGDKIHPLWYSENLPVLFFVSSIFAGLSIVIIEGTISHKVFSRLIPHKHHAAFKNILLGLGKGAAVTMVVYLFMKVVDFIHGEHWHTINSPMGYWYLVEILGFVCVPIFLYVEGVRNRNISNIRMAAVLTAVGIILNRLNISIIAYNWFAPVHYWPSWMEIVITLTIVFLEIWAFRWVVLRMPVVSEPPKWATEQSGDH